jgi:hypothetical protein
MDGQQEKMYLGKSPTISIKFIPIVHASAHDSAMVMNAGLLFRWESFALPLPYEP